MISLKVKIRKEVGKKVKKLREKDILPAVLYGPEIKESINLSVDIKEFYEIYKQAGESSLISLEVSSETEAKPQKFLVLIRFAKKDPLSEQVIHADFFQPSLKKEIQTHIPMVFEGESLAVKDLEGTLIKNIQELEIKALPQNLPHEIKVNIDCLKTFEDNILIKDLVVPENVTVLKEPEEMVASVVPPAKVEEELEKPVEEKVEDIEKAGEKEKEEKAEEKEEEKKEEKKEGSQEKSK
jgi:large subunit ribosomal protein L25